jgi:hypothetical protein
MMMTFDMAYEQFINQHHEAIGKLRDGHGYGEKLFLQKVWWPAFRNFDYFHPEYAIMDMRYGAYFLDYAYIPNPAVMQLAIEIDGYDP